MRGLFGRIFGSKKQESLKFGTGNYQPRTGLTPGQKVKAWKEIRQMNPNLSTEQIRNILNSEGGQQVWSGILSTQDNIQWSKGVRDFNSPSPTSSTSVPVTPRTPGVMSSGNSIWQSMQSDIYGRAAGMPAEAANQTIGMANRFFGRGGETMSGMGKFGHWAANFGEGAKWKSGARWGAVGALGLMSLSQARRTMDSARNRDIGGAAVHGAMAGAAGYAAYKYGMGQWSMRRHLAMAAYAGHSGAEIARGVFSKVHR